MNLETMELIDSLLEGSIDQESFNRLQEELRSDPVAMSHYLQQSEIHGRMEWEFGDPQRQNAPVSVGPKKIGVKPVEARMGALWMSAAALIIVMLGLLIWQVQSSSRKFWNRCGPSAG